MVLLNQKMEINQVKLSRYAACGNLKVRRWKGIREQMEVGACVTEN